MRTMNSYEEFIATSRYARWIEEEGRRESWTETVDRYMSFFKKHLESEFGVDHKEEIFKEVRKAIIDREVMPSMRALMSSGPALERSHMAAYNCAFVAMDHHRAFDEMLYILACGTGVGFSVERRHVEKMELIPNRIIDSQEVIKVADSREGWAASFRALIESLYSGYLPLWDVSEVRPFGARLKTFGGRASGPDPLEQLFQFTIDTFMGAVGRRLSPLEVHDLCCKIGDVVVSGGVRRSALISLSDLSNPEMAKAKSGAWWDSNGQRALANNSAVYTRRPSAEIFLHEWSALIESQSGERGIFNLEGVRALSPARRNGDLIEGANPCSEQALRSKGLCNLTEVVIRPQDNEQDILHKIGIAAIIGTWQASLTDFNYVRADWRQNAEEERLLGVSLTGIYGNHLFNNPFDGKLPARLAALKKRAVTMNEVWSERMGLNPSVAITTVKPSGTVSQLTGVSSGIHPWHSEFYARTVRGSNSDPLTKLMIDAGVPNEPDVTAPDKTTVFSFPVKAPEGARLREKVSAIEHLELYKVYRLNYSEHMVSITVNVRPNEWIEVANWVYKNWDSVAGISFLPYSEHTYRQAPYTELNEEAYKALIAASPYGVRFADLPLYEAEDSTTGSRELACAADGSGCEVVDIN